MAESMRRWFRFRLRSLLLVMLVCAIGLGLWKAGEEVATDVLLWASLPFWFPWSYVTIPWLTLFVARWRQSDGFRRYVFFAAVLTVITTPMSRFWWYMFGGYNSYDRLMFVPAAYVAGPIYITLLVFRARMRRLAQAGEPNRTDSVAVALLDCAVMVCAVVGVLWYAQTAEVLLERYWHWTSPAFDRRMPYLIWLCRVSGLALLWPALRRGWDARRLGTASRSVR
jgi:hypothetical protein